MNKAKKSIHFGPLLPGQQYVSRGRALANELRGVDNVEIGQRSEQVNRITARHQRDLPPPTTAEIARALSLYLRGATQDPGGPAPAPLGAVELMTFGLAAQYIELDARASEAAVGVGWFRCMQAAGVTWPRPPSSLTAPDPDTALQRLWRNMAEPGLPQRCEQLRRFRQAYMKNPEGRTPAQLRETLPKGVQMLIPTRRLKQLAVRARWDEAAQSGQVPKQLTASARKRHADQVQPLATLGDGSEVVAAPDQGLEALAAADELQLLRDRIAAGDRDVDRTDLELLDDLVVLAYLGDLPQSLSRRGIAAALRSRGHQVSDRRVAAFAKRCRERVERGRNHA